MPDDLKLLVECQQCGKNEIVSADKDGNPIITPGGPFMIVNWTGPLTGMSTGIYCRSCWNDAIAAIITSMIPPTTSTPVGRQNLKVEVEEKAGGEPPAEPTN